MSDNIEPNSTSTSNQNQSSTSNKTANNRGVATEQIEKSTVITGDSNTINNIIIVGRFLEFAQIEGLLPKIEHEEDFLAIVEAIQTSLGSRLNSDLADAVSWVGKLLEEFLNDWVTDDVYKAINLANLIEKLVSYLGKRLKQNGYWDAYSELYFESNDEFDDYVVPLDITTTLYRQNDLDQWQPKSTSALYLASNGDEHIFVEKECSEAYRDGTLICSPLKVYRPQQLRIILAGIVLDLIRIKSDNTISVQFLQELEDMVKHNKE